MRNQGLDFVGTPLRYKVIDGVSGLFQKKTEKVQECFDKIYYFKTESLNDANFKGLSYIVFYTGHDFIVPTLTQKQLSACIDARKGYIGFKSSVDRNRGVVHQYVVQPLNRAHPMPFKADLEVLVNKGLATPLF